MPNLQLHQLRVAAVAKLICDNFNGPLNANDVIAACLFHDMGNIIKSDLVQFPEFLEPQGRAYWENVKADFVAKYGDNAHDGNIAIAHELELPPQVAGYIDGISFSNIKIIAAGDSFEQKICEYADTRVGPYGILPMQARLGEARARYVAARSGKPYYTQDGFDELLAHAGEIESQIFQKASMTPEDVSDATVAPLLTELSDYPVP